MAYLLDADVVLHLSKYDLLELICKSFQCDLIDLRYLETAKYQIPKRLSGKEQQRAFEFLETISPVTAAPRFTGIFNDLIDSNLDIGEATLAAVACESEAHVVVTNDKRAIRSVCESASLVPKFEDKFVCLEQLILKGIKGPDFELIRQKISARSDVDKAIKICFSNGCSSLYTDVVSCFESNVNHLIASTSGLIRAI